MGKRGKKPAFVPAGVGGKVHEPPIGRQEAEAILEAPISSPAWGQICDAFLQYGFYLEEARGPTATGSKGDSRNYAERRAQATKLLERAFDQIQKVRRDDVRFAVSESWSLRHRARSGSFELERNLRAATDALHEALSVLRDAEPVVLGGPSEADCRRSLVAQIRDILNEDGAPSTVSAGSYWEALGPRERRDWASLQEPFERLIRALGIFEETSPEAFARGLRRALPS